MSLIPNKLLLNILACGLVLSCPLLEGAPTTQKPAQVEQEWTTFTSKGDGFSVELPKKPEHVQQKIDIPNTDLKIDYNTYLSEPSDNVVYVISVWNYPAQIDMSKPEVNLQDGFAGMLSALPGSEVTNMQMSEVEGHKALEFLVKNEDIFFQGKLILVHNTLYQVFTVYKNSVDMSDDYRNFIDSFKLINADSRKVTPEKKENDKKMNV